jgi:hypothetical protein
MQPVMNRSIGKRSSVVRAAVEGRVSSQCPAPETRGGQYLNR